MKLDRMLENFNFAITSLQMHDEPLPDLVAMHPHTADTIRMAAYQNSTSAAGYMLSSDQVKADRSGPLLQLRGIEIEQTLYLPPGEFQLFMRAGFERWLAEKERLRRPKFDRPNSDAFGRSDD